MVYITDESGDFRSRSYLGVVFGCLLELAYQGLLHIWHLERDFAGRELAISQVYALCLFPVNFAGFLVNFGKELLLLAAAFFWA